MNWRSERAFHRLRFRRSRTTESAWVSSAPRFSGGPSSVIPECWCFPDGFCQMRLRHNPALEPAAVNTSLRSEMWFAAASQLPHCTTLSTIVAMVWDWHPSGCPREIKHALFDN